MKTRKFKRGLLVLGKIAVAALFGVAVMLLWNALVPGIFGLALINYWQALGLLVLVRILFGGFGGHGMMFGGMMHAMHRDNPIYEKWAQMTPEERKEFVKRRMEHRHGGPFGRRGFFDEHDFDFNTNDNSSSNNNE